MFTDTALLPRSVIRPPPPERDVGLPQVTARRYLDLLAWMEASRGPADTQHLPAFLEEYPNLADAGIVL